MKGKGQIPVMKTIIGLILAAILVFWFVRFIGILGKGKGEAGDCDFGTNFIGETTTCAEACGAHGLECDPNGDCCDGSSPGKCVMMGPGASAVEPKCVGCEEECPSGYSLTGCDCIGEPTEEEVTNPHGECFELVEEDRNCSYFCNQRGLTCSDGCGWDGGDVVGIVYDEKNCNGDPMQWIGSCLYTADAGTPPTHVSIKCCCGKGK